MGYSFYLISKEVQIEKKDLDTTLEKLSPYNKEGGLRCDVEYNKNYIRVSGSYGISGKDAEGFVLNLLINLQQLNYHISVVSGDWDYGTEEDKKWPEQQ